MYSPVHERTAQLASGTGNFVLPMAVSGEYIIEKESTVGFTDEIYIYIYCWRARRGRTARGTERGTSPASGRERDREEEGEREDRGKV